MLSDSHMKIVRHQMRNWTREQRSNWAYDVLQSVLEYEKKGDFANAKKLMEFAKYVEEM